jgi:fructose-1,6-bisphosphatase
VQKSISTASTKETGTSNTFGDSQLEADMVTQTILMESFGKCKDVAVVSSEESPSDTVLSENGKYSVAFDPLDGSSIIPSNFSVGCEIVVHTCVNKATVKSGILAN